MGQGQQMVIKPNRNGTPSWRAIVRIDAILKDGFHLKLGQGEVSLDGGLAS